MRTEDGREGTVVDMLAALRLQRPDSRRMARTRARCLAELGRRRRPGGWTARPAALVRRRVLEPAFLTATIAAFLSEVVRRALALYGL